MSQPKPYPSDLSDAGWALIEPTLTAWRKAQLNHDLTGLARVKEGRKPEPTGSVIDRRPCRSSVGGSNGTCCPVIGG